MVREACALLFKLSGWKYVNKVPDEIRSFVFIGAPHTSNHDFVPAMAVSYLMRRNAKFVIKSEWMKFPMNMIMGPAGAMGLDRKKLKDTGRQSNVDAMAQLFSQHDELVLMIAPEGTRGHNDTWKTGFYYVAQKAGVPIVLGYADYEKKEAGMGMVIYPSNFDEDMQKIMDFYRNISGKKKEGFSLDKRFK